MITTFYALAGVAAFIFLGYEFISENKPKTVKYKPTPEPKLYQPSAKDYANLRAIADAHADWTAEVAQAFVRDNDREIVERLPIGAKIELCLDTNIDAIRPDFNGNCTGVTTFSRDKSRLYDVISNNLPLEIFKSSRVQYDLSGDIRFSIIAFYKIDGIAPTEVCIK